MQALSVLSVLFLLFSLFLLLGHLYWKHIERSFVCYVFFFPLNSSGIDLGYLGNLTLCLLA